MVGLPRANGGEPAADKRDDVASRANESTRGELVPAFVAAGGADGVRGRRLQDGARAEVPDAGGLAIGGLTDGDDKAFRKNALRFRVLFFFGRGFSARPFFAFRGLAFGRLAFGWLTALVLAHFGRVVCFTIAIDRLHRRLVARDECGDQKERKKRQRKGLHRDPWSHSYGPRSTRTDAAVKRSVVLGWLGSLLVHGAVMLSLEWTTIPEVDLTFEVPLEVEFGMSEAMTMASASNTPEAAPEAAEPPVVEPNAASTGPGEGPDAGPPEDTAPPPDTEPPPDTAPPERRDTGPRERPDTGRPDTRPPDTGHTRDTGPRDAGPTRDAGSGRDAGRGDAGDSGRALRASNGVGERSASTIPPGAQIALRMNMAEVRRSPLAPQVRSLLAALPDWDAILGGSGINPVDDLERLLIATPNLRPRSFVMAGSHAKGRGFTRQVVARFSTLQGVSPRWQTRRDGVSVAAWPNRAATQRVIAELSPSHFSITRRRDLARVIALAAAREARVEGEDVEQSQGIDALLSMGAREAVSLEIEGARRYVPGGAARRFVPERGRIALAHSSPSRVQVRGLMTFADEDAARAAERFWDRKRQQFARSTLMVMSGMSRALLSITSEIDGSRVRLRGELTIQQARLIFAQVQMIAAEDRRAREARRSPREGVQNDGTLVPGISMINHRPVEMRGTTPMRSSVTTRMRPTVMVRPPTPMTSMSR